MANLARLEPRKFWYDTSRPASTDMRFRDRLEFRVALNRPAMSDQGVWVLLTDWEWFWEVAGSALHYQHPALPIINNLPYSSGYYLHKDRFARIKLHTNTKPGQWKTSSSGHNYGLRSAVGKRRLAPRYQHPLY